MSCRHIPVLQTSFSKYISWIHTELTSPILQPVQLFCNTQTKKRALLLSESAVSPQTNTHFFSDTPQQNVIYRADSLIQISQLAALLFPPLLTFQKCQPQSSLGLNHVPPLWSHCRPIISTGQLFYFKELLWKNWIWIYGHSRLHLKNYMCI